MELGAKGRSPVNLKVRRLVQHRHGTTRHAGRGCAGPRSAQGPHELSPPFSLSRLHTSLQGGCPLFFCAFLSSAGTKGTTGAETHPAEVAPAGPSSGVPQEDRARAAAGGQGPAVGGPGHGRQVAQVLRGQHRHLARPHRPVAARLEGGDSAGPCPHTARAGSNRGGRAPQVRRAQRQKAAGQRGVEIEQTTITKELLVTCSLGAPGSPEEGRYRRTAPRRGAARGPLEEPARQQVAAEHPSRHGAPGQAEEHPGSREARGQCRKQRPPRGRCGQLPRTLEPRPLERNCHNAPRMRYCEVKGPPNAEDSRVKNKHHLQDSTSASSTLKDPSISEPSEVLAEAALPVGACDETGRDDSGCDDAKTRSTSQH